jgi:hypothetical protein
MFYAFHIVIKYCIYGVTTYLNSDLHTRDVATYIWLVNVVPL